MKTHSVSTTPNRANTLLTAVVLAVITFVLAVPHSSQAESSIKLLEDVEIHGFVSSSYTYNFNEPASRTNALRAFDTDHNSFKLDVAELSLLKEAEEPGDIGFRTDIVYGFSQPEVLKNSPRPNVNGTNVSDDDFDVQQGYVSYLAPVGNGILMDLGKFDSHIGLEVNDGWDGWNWNFSRSYLYNLATPAQHTGFRVGYEINDQLNILLMVTNGWDNNSDNNDSKSYGASFEYSPFDSLFMAVNWMGGPEKDNNDDDWRNIVDFYFVWGMTDQWELQFNFDYGIDEKSSGVTAGDDAVWWGTQVGLRYGFNKWISLNLRGEYFNDEDAFVASGLGFPEELWEFTITPEFQISQNLIIRAEYRYDKSNLNAFQENNTPTDTQQTAAINALIYF